MHCKPQLLLDHHRRKPKISVILIDWGVRESFHSLHYLNRQTANRDDYELIWLEFYDHKPEGLRRMVDGSRGAALILDRWLVMGYPADLIFHKHRLYNVGILAARGDVCVICDSDAIFEPTFIEKIVETFAESPNAVVHLDEVRNVRQDLHPFRYPSIEEILGPGCINWRGKTSFGLDDSPDMIHHANYGACMAARRKDLLAIGGADEHLDYLGYVCGPYELTFRLVNYGREEHWLRDEYLYHTWHPNQYGFNTDYQGPHDGAHMALLALDARASYRTRPVLPNPWFSQVRRSTPLDADRLLWLASQDAEPTWKTGAQPPLPGDRVYWIERDYYGFDIFNHAGRWYALRAGRGPFDPEKMHHGGYRELWEDESQPALRQQLPIHREEWEARENNRSRLARLWRKFRARPLHDLPGRVARQARRLTAS